MIYKVEITETLSRIVEVDAESREDAEIKVQEEYRNEHIVLDAEDMKESTIKIYEEEQKEGVKSEYKEMER